MNLADFLNSMIEAHASDVFIVAGLPLTPVYDWQPTEAEQAVVDAMPCYPAEGGVVIVGDLCIVRFS